MASWLLIHSPLVGAATWTPTAAQLRQLGHDVVVPDLTPALAFDQTDHASRQADLVVASVESGPVVLVGHSGAGPLLPPWASWWPPEILLALLPERHQRDRLVQSSPRLPVTLFDETLPAANEGLAILTAPQQIAETLQALVRRAGV